jgi:hypothetical protein
MLDHKKWEMCTLWDTKERAIIRYVWAYLMVGNKRKWNVFEYKWYSQNKKVLNMFVNSIWNILEPT